MKIISFIDGCYTLVTRKVQMVAVEITNLYNEDDVNCRNTNLNEDLIVAVVIEFKQVLIHPKQFRGFNGIRTHGLALALQCSTSN